MLKCQVRKCEEKKMRNAIPVKHGDLRCSRLRGVRRCIRETGDLLTGRQVEIVPERDGSAGNEGALGDGAVALPRASAAASADKKLLYKLFREANISSNQLLHTCGRKLLPISSSGCNPSSTEMTE